MANKLTSPGWSFNEIDQSAVPAVTLGRPQAIIGTANRGKAFIPTIVTNWDSFTSQFGERDIYKHGPYCAYYTFKKSSPIMYTRVLGIDTVVAGTVRHCGFKVNNAYAILVTGSDSASYIAGVVHSSGLLNVSGTSAKNFTLTNGSNSYTCSLYRGDKNYYKKVLNTEPAAYPSSSKIVDGVTSKGYYLFRDFSFEPKIYNGTSVTASLISTGVDGADYQQAFTHAQSPWVSSQNYGTTLVNPINYTLFKFHALGDGQYENTNFKISVENIRASVNAVASEYSTFDVVIRDYEDNDKNPQILEKFVGLDLNPNSKNYIAKRIGDIKMVWNSSTNKIDVTGDYPNKSSLIRVEIYGDLNSGMVPKDSLPWSFNSAVSNISGSMVTAVSGSGQFTSGTLSVPNIPFVVDQKFKGEYNAKMHWGFTSVNSSSGDYWYLEDKLQYIPSTFSVVYDPSFTLDFLSSSTALTSSFANGDYSVVKYISNGTGSNLTSSDIQGTSLAQFTMPMFGGWDGLDVHYKDPFNNLKMANFVTANYGDSTDWEKSYELTSLREAVDTLKNQDVIDIKDLAIPGIFHPGVLGYNLDMVQDRTDVFTICDISGSTVEDAKTWRETSFTYDTSYGACYFPRFKIYDNFNDKYVWLYPTAVLLGVLGYTDVVAYPWYAPAGMNRGDITSDVVRLEVETNQDERNDLYDRQINPIAKLEGNIVVWGQKTLQLKASALDRVNVRRMLLHIKKAFAGYTKFLVFENVNQSLFDRFKSLADPFLGKIIQNNGLNAYRLIVDDTNNTKETKENNEVHVKLLLEPTPSGEKFFFDFIITRQGVLST